MTEIRETIAAHGQNAKVLKFKEDELMAQLESGKGDPTKIWEALEKNFEAQSNAFRTADTLAGEYMGTCDEYTYDYAYGEYACVV